MKKLQIVSNRRSAISKLIILFISIYFFLAPLEFVINGLIGGSSLRYVGILIILLIILEHLVKNYNLKINNFSIYLFLLSFLQIASVLWLSNFNNLKIYLTIYILSSLIFIAIDLIPYIRFKDLSFVINSYYVGVSIFSFLLLINGSQVSDTVVRETLIIFGIYLDPNNVAAFILIGYAICLNYILKIKYDSLSFRKVFKRILHFIMLVLMLISIFKTGSRGGFISLVFVSLIIYVGSLKNKKISQILTSIFISIIIIQILLFISENFIDSEILNRVFEFEDYKGGSMRTTIWKNLLDTFKEKPFFGFGVSSFIGIMGHATHNTFLTILFENGLLGFLLILLFLLSLIKRAYKINSSFCISLVFCTIIPCIFLDALFKRFFWIPLLIVQLIIKFYENHECSNKEYDIYK